MLQNQKTDRIFATIVFVAGFLTYWSSVAPTTSFWDCGEFIACSYTMGVPHPPGSPLFLLWGRFFSLLPIASDIGLRVNMISVIVSSFSLLFLYLTTVRLIRMYRGADKNWEDGIIVGGGAMIGTLALGFSYSFWFNSIEAEVYSASTFFTAIALWLILKWTDHSNEPKGDRILLFLAYTIGLATGVHLLNLLAMWSLFMIIYFHKYEFTIKGFLIQLGIASVAFVVVYPGVVKYIPALMKMASFWAPVIVILILIVVLRYLHLNKKRILSVSLMAILLVILGYSTYMTLFIRSNLQPRIDENNPDNIERFVSYVNREQYGEIDPFTRNWNNNPNYTDTWDFFWRYQVHHMYTRYFLWQFVGMEGDAQNSGVDVTKFWALPLLLGFIGMALHFQKDGKRAFTILSLFLMAGYGIILYLNQNDPQPRERDYSYVGSFYAFAIWIGIGAVYLLDLVKHWLRNNGGMRKIGIYASAVVIFAVVPLNMLTENYDMCKRTGNYVAWDYSHNILESCEPDGIIFTNGDNDTFPLWYLQEVENVRRDIRVVNLSLLNTGWYIKQLMEQEPVVPISFTKDYVDKYIDRHDWEALKTRYWPEAKEIGIDTPEGTYQWKLEPTMRIPGIPNDTGGNNFLRVQDIMILNIMHANQGKRPIYFAVTVSNSNMLGIRDYMTMDGLAFKVSPVKSGPIDPEHLRVNLFENFANNYRNLNNPNVTYNDNIIKLLQNYRSAFLQLAYHYYSRKDDGLEPENMPLAEQYVEFDSLSSRAKVNLILRFMEEKIPEDVIPLNNDEITLQLGRMYYEIGYPEELEKRLDRLAARGNWEKKTQYGLMYQQWLHNDEKAAELFDMAIEEVGDDVEATVDIIALLGRVGQTDKAMNMLDDILKKDVSDKVKLSVASAYYQLRKDSLASGLYEDLVNKNNADGQAVGGLLTVYERMGEYGKALSVLDKWLTIHPADSQAVKKRIMYQKKLASG